VFGISYLSNYSLKYKASFTVVLFKCPSYNALNGRNVDYLKEIF